MSLPPQPTTRKKAFVAYLDTHYGATLLKRLLAADYDVSGIVHQADSSVSNKVKKVFRRSDVEGIRKTLLEADFVIYQLVDTVHDAVSAVRLLTTNHYENEKRFILVSSVLSWFETPPLTDAAPAGELAAGGEEPEKESLTEDQYNRRVPHIKYLAWRDMEKTCCSCKSDRLKSFVLFSGLQYGLGEYLLHPIFKQAWRLSDEGLPSYGNGKQIVPMIHISDLVSVSVKLLTAEELPENRYLFATDDGNCSWNDIVRAINNSIGNGKTFAVPTTEYCLHDNVEHFTVNLKLEAQQIQSLLPEEEWASKAGFVENIEKTVTQYRKEREVTPFRILVSGAPLSGKTFVSRELSAALCVPTYTVAEIVTEYSNQLMELQEEVDRIRYEKFQAKVKEKLEERRLVVVEERKAKMEAAIAEAVAAPETLPFNEDDDDVEEEEEIDVHLTAEEEKELQDQCKEDDGDERVTSVNEKMEEIKKVLNMKLKLTSENAHTEPPNPKDKKKSAVALTAKKSGKGAAVPDEADDAKKEVRYNDRALAIMVRWRLSRTQCRNQGYILDGYPKTIKQARLLLEDSPLDVPEDPDEPELLLDAEEKPCVDSLFPEFVVHCKVSDTFLVERLQKVQFEHPHNAPEDFQRRLDLFKQNFDAAVGVSHYLESCRSTSGKNINLRIFDVESCPLVPPPPPKSPYAAKAIDPVVIKMMDFLGKSRNFGASPQDTHREQTRQKKLLLEDQAERDQAEARRREKEIVAVSQAQKSKSDEVARVAAMRDHERQMLEQRKEPLKAFLMANVVPVLTKGLIEVCNRRPEDPVDFLAEWLFRHNPEDTGNFYN